RCHPRILSRIAACVALLVLAAVVPAQATLSDIQFECRFPGPFWISTYDHTQPSEKEGTSTNPGWNHGLSHPYTDWTIGSIQGPITLSDGSEQTTWAGCSVPLRNGTFDVRLTTRMLAADVQYLKYEVRPQFTG